MSKPARTILTNATIHTMDDAHPRAHTLLLGGGAIVAVDEAYDPDDAGLEVIDLAGRHVVPGFIDSHHHLSIAALYPRWIDLLTVSGPEELQAALRRQAADEPDADWIRAANWVPELHGTFDRRLLDSFGLDRPVMLAGHSLHEGVVDSRGLDLLQVSAATPDPPAGLIARDERGEPTGYLVEAAWSCAHALSLRGYADPQRWADLIVQRAEALLRDGVTAIHDAACSPEAEAVYRELAASGRLPISVLGMPHAAAMLTNDLGARLDGPPTGEGDEWFRVGPVKLFADGGSQGAVSAPADPDTLAAGLYFADIAEQIPLLVERGYRVAVHAVGDYAIRGCLQAFGGVARRADDDHRFRLEHVIKPRPEQITAMSSLGVIAAVQPGIINHYGDRVLAAGRPGLAESFFPFATLLASGVALAASSDDPCAPFGPLRNSITGATRRTPSGAVLGAGQALPLLEWIRAYTAGSTHAGGQEHERGRLKAGLRADLVVLDGEPDAGAGPRVAETWVAGRRVWAA